MTIEQRRTIGAYLAQHRERLGGSPLINFPESYVFDLAALPHDDVLDDAFFAHVAGQSRVLLGPAFDDGRIGGWTVQ